MSYDQDQKAGEAQKVDDMANMILDKMPFISIFETDELLFPRNGVYHMHGEKLVKEYCETWASTNHWHSTNHFVNEVVQKIIRKRYVKHQEFDRDPYLINLHNGLLDLHAWADPKKRLFLPIEDIPEPSPGQIQTLSSRVDRTFRDAIYGPKNIYLSRIQLPVDYNPDTKSPKILKFLNEVLPDPVDRRVVLEFAAITLFRSPMFHRALMLVGEGRNGKSTFIFLLKSLLGRDNVSNVSIHDLIGNRFKIAEVDGKLGNFYPDINGKELTQLGILQAIIAGDTIQVERKGRDPFPMDAFVKLIFSCNKLPQVSDPTLAWWERWSIVTFRVNFSGRENRNLATQDCTGELQTSEELSGFFNLLLEVLRGVLQRKRLTDSKTNDQKRQEWGEMANHLVTFIGEKLAVRPEGYIESALLYPSYVSWCGTKYIPLGRREFFSQLEALVPIREETRRLGGRTSKSKKIWKGVSFKDGSSGTLDDEGKGPPMTPSEEAPGTPEAPDVARGAWVARERGRDYFPSRRLDKLADQAKREGWGQFSGYSKEEEQHTKRPKTARDDTIAQGLRALDSPAPKVEQAKQEPEAPVEPKKEEPSSVVQPVTDAIVSGGFFGKQKAKHPPLPDPTNPHTYRAINVGGQGLPMQMIKAEKVEEDETHYTVFVHGLPQRYKKESWRLEQFGP